jgi:PDZ domain
MRKILGFGVVLAAAYLTGTVGAAYGQQRGGATAPNTIANPAINTAVQGATGTPNQPGGIGANAAAPTNVQVPGTAGSVLNQTGVTGARPATASPGTMTAGAGAKTAAPGNVRVPRTAGTVLNRAGVTRTSPANTVPGRTYTPGVGNPARGNYAANAMTNAVPGFQQGTYPGTATGATPGSTGRVMLGVAGYNSVNPMGTTMAPGYYYANTAGMPYATYNNTPGYGYPYYGYGNAYGYGYPYYSNYAAPGVGVAYTSGYGAPTGSAANTVRPAQVMPAQGRHLGIDEDPVGDPTGRRGMMVSNVYPGTPALRAGLRVGDVIYSINGYVTEQRGNLAWIMANAAPNNQLNMTLKHSSDGQDRVITAQIP